MRKFQIFLFIEACLLTGALILMVSEHFSRFLLILLLFLLLIRYYTGKQGNNFILVAILLPLSRHNFLKNQIGIFSFLVHHRVKQEQAVYQGHKDG